MTQTLRTMALGGWGEEKASKLLKRAGFRSVRNLNSEIPNHLFADIYAERDVTRYIIGVKTRNRLTAAGTLNPSYNARKKGKDLSGLAARYKAIPAWIAIQVDAEAQKCSAYFGPLVQLTVESERYSIPMTPQSTAHYECLAHDECDRTIQPQWSNRIKR
jgi:hypothetical protein